MENMKYKYLDWCYFNAFTEYILRMYVRNSMQRMPILMHNYEHDDEWEKECIPDDFLLFCFDDSALYNIFRLKVKI